MDIYFFEHTHVHVFGQRCDYIYEAFLTQTQVPFSQL